MFEVLKLRITDGTEYRITGDSRDVNLEWRYRVTDEWDTLYFTPLEDGGIQRCLAKLDSEVQGYIYEGGPVDILIYKECKRQPHQD